MRTALCRAALACPAHVLLVGSKAAQYPPSLKDQVPDTDRKQQLGQRLSLVTRRGRGDKSSGLQGRPEVRTEELSSISLCDHLQPHVMPAGPCLCLTMPRSFRALGEGTSTGGEEASQRRLPLGHCHEMCTVGPRAILSSLLPTQSPVPLICMSNPVPRPH